MVRTSLALRSWRKHSCLPRRHSCRRRATYLCAIFGLILLTVAAFAQAPAFDVASIKMHLAELKGPGDPTVSVTKIGATIRNANLQTLVAAAYSVKDYQVIVPSALNNDRYDIDAKSAAPAAPDQIRLMLQDLLAKRFQMTFHRDSKEMTTYVLVPGKGPNKLKPSAVEADSKIAIEGSSLVFRNYTMAKLATFLNTRSDHPVADESNLTGQYDFSAWLGTTEGGAMELKMALAHAMDDGTLASTIAEQAGLKLETRKSPTPILIIDHATRASEN